MATSTITEQVYGIADLVVVNYEKLQQKDVGEASKLYSACVEWGFFYLDLGDSGEKAFLATVEELFAVSKEYFSKPVEEKLKDMRSGIDVFNICGYKPMGRDQGNVKNKKDGCEGLRLPTNLLYDPTFNPHLSIPEGIKKDWPTVTEFMKESYSISSTILTILSDGIGLRGDQRLERQHRVDLPSTSTAVLQSYPLKDLPPNISQGHFTHTPTPAVFPCCSAMTGGFKSILLDWIGGSM